MDIPNAELLDRVVHLQSHVIHAGEEELSCVFPYPEVSMYLTPVTLWFLHKVPSDVYVLLYKTIL